MSVAHHNLLLPGASRRIAARLARGNLPAWWGASAPSAAAVAAQVGRPACARVVALTGRRAEAVRLLRGEVGQWLLRPHSPYDALHLDPGFNSLHDYPPFQEMLRPKGE